MHATPRRDRKDIVNINKMQLPEKCTIQKCSDNGQFSLGYFYTVGEHNKRNCCGTNLVMVGIACGSRLRTSFNII